MSAAVYGDCVVRRRHVLRNKWLPDRHGNRRIGIGIYFAIDLALVTDVLPDSQNAAKDLGVFNIAGAYPNPSPPPSAGRTQ